MKILSSIFKRLTDFSGATLIAALLLIILGISKGIPGVDLVVDDNSRRLAAFFMSSSGMKCGLALALMAVLLRIRKCNGKDDSTIGGTIEELTPTQRAILNTIINEYKLHGIVSQDFIESKFKKISQEEMYYRLEHLLFKGFIIKEKTGHDGTKFRFSYKLSDKYRESLKIPALYTEPLFCIKLGKNSVHLLMISGGEPLLHPKIESFHSSRNF